MMEPQNQEAVESDGAPMALTGMFVAKLVDSGSYAHGRMTRDAERYWQDNQTYEDETGCQFIWMGPPEIAKQCGWKKVGAVD